jgi:hypothetical protein
VTAPKDNDLVGNRIVKLKARIGAQFDKSFYLRFNIISNSYRKTSDEAGVNNITC